MKIIGDIHGDVKYYDKVMKSGPTIQVGDFGYCTRNEIPFYYVRGGFSIDRLDP